MAQNEEIEIVGGNNADADASCVVVESNSIIGRQYSDHPQYQDLVAALQSRSYGGNLTKKKEVLLLFLPSKLDDVERYCSRDLWREYGRHLFSDIRSKSTKPSDITQNFKMEFVAECLTELYVLNQWIKEMPPTERSRRRVGTDPMEKTKKAFTSLTRYVGPILKKYGEDQAKKKKASTKSKVNLQQNGTRIQDTVPFDPNYITKDTCPNPTCQHYYCQPTANPDEIKNKQQRLDEKFNERLAEWSAKPAATRGGKPRKQKSVCSEMACHCVNLFCGYRDDGGDCPSCKAAAAAGQSMVFIGGDGKSHCRCEICNCKCQIIYPLNDRRKVKLDFIDLSTIPFW